MGFQTIIIPGIATNYYIIFVFVVLYINLTMVFTLQPRSSVAGVAGERNGGGIAMGTRGKGNISRAAKFQLVDGKGSI